MLKTVLDDHCDKLAVERRKYCQLSWPTTVQFTTLWASMHFRRAKLITRFADRYAVAKFSQFSQVQSLEQSSRGKYLDFWRYPNFLITLCRIGRRKLSRENQLDSFNRFDRTPTCDIQTDRQTDRHRAIAIVPALAQRRAGNISTNEQGGPCFSCSEWTWRHRCEAITSFPPMTSFRRRQRKSRGQPEWTWTPASRPSCKRRTSTV